MTLTEALETANFYIPLGDHGVAAMSKALTDRIRELEARDHCPCEDCKRSRAQSENEPKP